MGPAVKTHCLTTVLTILSNVAMATGTVLLYTTRKVGELFVSRSCFYLCELYVYPVLVDVQMVRFQVSRHYPSMALVTKCRS